MGRRQVEQTKRNINLSDAQLAQLDDLSIVELDFIDGVTAGTQVASKAVITDSNVNSGVSKVTQLHIGTSGSETQVNATGSELNRSADLSARLVTLTGSLSITEALHEGRDMYITGTAAATYTLPEATGSGARYRFIIGEVNTNGTIFVVADTSNTNFIGKITNLDLDAAPDSAFGPAANTDTITLNGTTTGGAIGDTIEILDVATDVWMVTGSLQTPTGSNPATSFSAAV